MKGEITLRHRCAFVNTAPHWSRQPSRPYRCAMARLRFLIDTTFGSPLFALLLIAAVAAVWGTT